MKGQILLDAKGKELTLADTSPQYTPRYVRSGTIEDAVQHRAIIIAVRTASRLGKSGAIIAHSSSGKQIVP